MKSNLLNTYKWILIACVMMGFTTEVTATHLTGGEFTYRYLYSANSKAYYETRLVIYRNCNSATGFGNPICEGVYKGNNFSSIGNKSVYMAGSARNVSPKCSSMGTCVEEAVYIDTLNFPTNQSYGVYVTCGGTARNNAIVNLDLTTGNAGMAWQIYIPAPSQSINSSPKFNNTPLAYIYTGKQTVFNNNSAYDADGDSLVYSFVLPYGSNNPGGGCPTSGYPVPPPLSYTTCKWASGYSVTQPFGSKGSITMDSFTGEITATSPSSSNFVVVIQIDEYRRLSNGSIVYMGETRRDIQILSKTKANYYQPVITNYGSSTNKTIYAGKNNCFNISGIDSLGDSLTISATGIMFDSVYWGSSPLATFATKSDDSVVTQQFCWNPSCSQASKTPYILTIDLIDKDCNRSQKTFTIIVDTLWSDSITENICSGDTFNFYGNKLTTAGTYIDSSVQNACNSSYIITTLTLNVNSASSSSITDHICQGNFYHFNGKKINTAGTYTDTLINTGGCDSIITLNLNILSQSYDSISAAICSGKNYNFNGKKISKAGIYYDTTLNYLGCDSIITLNLNTLSPSYDSINASICQGKTYNFNGKNISKAGSYYDTTVNYLGCDSIIEINLTVNSATTDTITVGICAGFSYTFKGQNISKTGFYYDTTTNYLGCDSVIVLNLVAGNYSNLLIQDTICQGDVYHFNGKNISTAGNYADTLKGANGCDSVVALVLTVNALKSLGNILGQKYVYMHDTVNYAVNNNATSGFTWAVTGGTIVSGQGTNQIRVLWDTVTAGTISVQLNCYDTSNLNIYITNAIYSVCPLPDIRIYPNPSDGSFNIQFNSPISSKSELSIYNTIGQKIYNTLLQTGTNQYKIELENQSAGCYYIYIKSAGNIIVQKIVVNK